MAFITRTAVCGFVLGVSICLVFEFNAVRGQFPKLSWSRNRNEDKALVHAEGQFVQTHPDSKDEILRRTPDRSRAVVLIHGLRLHPLRPAEATRSRLHGWQRPQSAMVRALAPHADVFAFAYCQNVPVEEIADSPCLVHGMASLKELGYDEIVLIGHSAGGLIARQFVEDHSDIGVTRVIQVCAPNAGAGYADFKPAAPKAQQPFLKSLTKEARTQCLRGRCDKTIPVEVDFHCVVGCGAALGDGVVSIRSQWPADLEAQGVPVHRLWTTHYTVMRSPVEVRRIAELACALHRKESEMRSWRAIIRRGAALLSWP